MASGRVLLGLLLLALGMAVLSQAYRIGAIFGVTLPWVRQDSSIPLLHERVRLILPEGDAIVLVEPTATTPDNDANRNVYRLNERGHVIWQIGAAISGAGPFTNIYFNDVGQLTAYSSDGCEYPIAPTTGQLGAGTLVS